MCTLLSGGEHTVSQVELQMSNGSIHVSDALLPDVAQIISAISPESYNQTTRVITFKLSQVVANDTLILASGFFSMLSRSIIMVSIMSPVREVRVNVCKAQTACDG